MKKNIYGIILLVLIVISGAYLAYTGLPSRQQEWQKENFAHYNPVDVLENENVEWRVLPGLPRPGGWYLVQLGEKGLLHHLGFKEGDWVTKVNGRAVKESTGLEVAMRTFLAGQGIYIEYYRDQQRKVFAAVLQ